MTQKESDYQKFVDYGTEIREPIEGLGVYAAQHRRPKDDGWGGTEVRRRFAVIDVDDEEILYQSTSAATYQKQRLGRYQYYALGYRDALLDERDMETDQ